MICSPSLTFNPWLVVAIMALTSLMGGTLAQRATVSVNSGDGTYTVSVDSEAVFHSGPTWLISEGVTYASSNGTLKLKGHDSGKGQDTHGSYSYERLTWMAGNVSYVTSFKTYNEHDMIVFGQSFPKSVQGTATGNRDGIISSFPAFNLTSSQDYGVVSFQGDMCASGTRAGKISDHVIGQGISDSGPIVFFQKDLNTSFVLSAYSNFMAHSQNVMDNSLLSYGIMGNVSEVPAGYQIETIFVVSSGINHAMEDWGDALLRAHGKERRAYRRDYAMNVLGYSTDNGAYYYYQTEPDKNYEDTILDVKSYADSVNIPYRYILLDSWWYYKGSHSGVTVWDARPDVFPHGLEYLHNKTGWRQQLHNRYWSAQTPYAKQNGGQWEFIVEDQIALPVEQAFWDWLMLEKRNSGMFMYEQDWLDNEFDHCIALGSSATLARQWMLQMGSAAERNGMTIQLCMSHVRHILQGVEMPAATNARASGDYHPGNTQWDVGRSSILAWATGIAPSKDNYWSTPVQDGTHYGKDTREPYNRLQAAVITLTTGPVAPSDKINASDADLILRSCTMGGVLLQPDKPATAMDSTFLHDAFGQGADGKLWSTYTALPGGPWVSYVMAIDMNSDYDVTVDSLGYTEDTVLVAVEANKTTQTVKVTSSSPLQVKSCGRYDFQLFTLSPVLDNGWALLGEPNKWTSVSGRRFSNLVAEDDAISVELFGDPSEKVQVSFADPNLKVVQCQCTVDANSHATVTITTSDSSCSCA